MCQQQKISIHALAKRATIVDGVGDVLDKHFNPRPRKEGDHLNVPLCIKLCYFNPRPRKEGDQINRPFSLPPVDFNPRPRKEGDQPIYVVQICGKISIHALAKRATGLTNDKRKYWQDFNPRPRKEGDRKFIQ